MTQIATDPNYLSIADALDAVGQKYRVYRLLAGTVSCLALGIMLTITAALSAHLLGQSRWTMVVGGLWIATLAAALVVWLLRPLLMRPRPLEVARLIESRIEGMNNGLTNTLLLARAADLVDSPWLGQIFAEVASESSRKPLNSAVRLSDLRPKVLRLGLALLPFIVVAVLFPSALAQGWQQMFRPAAFVPSMGMMRIISVDPGDATRVLGQPLEITLLASGPRRPDATIVFDQGHDSATLVASADSTADIIRYTYRVDRVDQSFRYRLELGGTQSNWYSVTAIRQLHLASLTCRVEPPAYTGQSIATIKLDPAAPDRTPITVPQGSTVELSAGFDVPVKGAMLAIGDEAPVEMSGSSGQAVYLRKFVVLADESLQVLPTESGQVLAKLPESPLVIHCTTDQPPHVVMQWPRADVTVAPGAPLHISAQLGDDWGVTSGRIMLATSADAAMTEAGTFHFSGGRPTEKVDYDLAIPSGAGVQGTSIFIQIEATDNRDLSSVMKDGGHQTTAGPRIEIRFRDPAQAAAQQKESFDRLRERLLEMLKTQQDLYDRTVIWRPTNPDSTTALASIGTGQTDLRARLDQTATTFEFTAQTRVIQTTLQELAADPAKDASELPAALAAEPVLAQQQKLARSLEDRQRTIISTLQSLIGGLAATTRPANLATTRTADPLLSNSDALKKLDEALQEFMKQQQRILDQTASLAKKPVENYDDADKKLAADLPLQQEKLDAFLQQALSDYSKQTQQDMSNPALLKELTSIYSEVTMAADALKAKAEELAIPLEENGLELAKELESNLEKWLADKPDRQQWNLEDPTDKTQAPMAELPQSLQDMVGDLLEQQEDLFQEMEDSSSAWHDTLDKGNGWDAVDGPISDNSAKGITGNTLPNNNEMQGRSGEGRTGQSQGEFVDDTAVGKGGRNTPTRLDPTPFEKGQVNDTSKDPLGGATGGGKLSGQGGQGLEGPVPPGAHEEMQRLAEKQAQLRNQAERLNLQYELGRYDNFKMLDSIMLMRRVESDLNANHYTNALHERDILVNDLQTSKVMVDGQISVEHDTTPASNQKTRQDISDAMKGSLPAAWQDALKQYYQKLSSQ
jgi:hypothetical protein